MQPNDEMRETERKEQEQAMLEAAAWLFRTGRNHTTGGNFRLPYRVIQRHTGVQLTDDEAAQRFVRKALGKMPGAITVVADANGIQIRYNTDCCPRVGRRETMLRDVLTFPWRDIHLVAVGCDSDPQTITLGERAFTEDGLLEWGDILNGVIEEVKDGPWGVQIHLREVDPYRLDEFSLNMAGAMTGEEEALWLNPPARTRGMTMGM